MRLLNLLLLVSILAIPGTAGASYRVLYRFQGGSDGEYPGQITSDAAGNLYGVSRFGGGGTCDYSGLKGCGTIFQLTPPAAGKQAWTETILHRFSGGSDGAFPASLAFDTAGNLFGVTSGGGTGSCSVYGAAGCGTVFELTPPAAPGSGWTETVIYQFTSAADGLFPVTAIHDAAGNLYGVTLYGGRTKICGSIGCGTAFSLTSSAGGWAKSTIYEFKGTPQNAGIKNGDGSQPQGLVMDSSGALYGTTQGGGHCDGQAGCMGAAFRLTPPAAGGGAWTEKVLYRFLTGATAPVSGFVLDAAGNLYGGSEYNIYELTTADTLTTLFRFSHQTIADPAGGMIFDAAGNLWGTSCGSGPNGNGTVFELSPPAAGGSPWKETRIHGFQAGNDGQCPDAPLVAGAPGVYYGTAMSAGNTKCKAFAGHAMGCGIVFEVGP